MYYVRELVRLRLVLIQVPKFLPPQTKGPVGKRSVALDNDHYCKSVHASDQTQQALTISTHTANCSQVEGY